jgi:Flp pilus assembly protein TadG
MTIPTPWPRRLVGILSRFRTAKTAIAAVEFAVIMPMLVLFIVGGAELARYINTTRKLTNLAESLANLMAERTTAIAYDDLMFNFNSTLVTFPQVLRDAANNGVGWNADISVTLSSIKFTPTVTGCTASCTYKASVIWTAGSLARRSCTVAPLSAPDTATPSLLTLPADVFTSGTIVVADVSFTYQPLFGGRFFPASTVLRRSVYLQPRYLTEIDFDPSAGSLSGIGSVC